MKKGVWLTTIAATACLAGMIYCVYTSELQSRNRFRPCLNNGKKWTIGYLQSGKLKRYNSSFRCFIDQLAQLGWLEPVDWSKLPPPASALAAWHFLADNMRSEYLQIHKKHFWCHDWHLATRRKNKKTLLTALARKEVDLMLAMGSWASLDMADRLHGIPTLALGSSFSLNRALHEQRKIPDHLYLPHYPDLLLRQIRLFRKIVKFHSLGVAYADSAEGRHRAGLKQLRSFSKQENFVLVEVEIQVPGNTKQEELLRQYIKAHNRLAPRVDAMWITTTLVNSPDSAAKVLAPFFKHKVPTWYPHGQEGVAHGVVFGMVSNPRKQTDYHARAAARILNGAKPADLARNMTVDNSLAINCAAADKIAFKIPKTLLAVTQKSYLKINTGEDK